LLNGQTSTCNGVATGTVETVIVDASASPTTIDITSAAHNTTLTADIGATSTDPNNANYTYKWSVITAGVDGELTDSLSRVATFTAGLLDQGTTIEFRVVATQALDANSPECVDDDTVSVTVTSAGACTVTPHGDVCTGSVASHKGTPSPIPSTATYTWELQGTTSTFRTPPGINGDSVAINAITSYKLILNQVYDNTALNTSCSTDVVVVATPGIDAEYIPPTCSQDTFSVKVKNTTLDFKYSITQPGNSSTKDTITGDGGDITFTGLSAGDGYIVKVNTGGPGCTATSDCETNGDVVVSESVLDPNTDPNKPNNIAETYNINLQSNTKVKALPNPYTERVRFNLVSGVSGIASLEIHNMLGQKVAVVYNGYIQAGRELTKEFFVPFKDRSTLIYTFRVGDQKVSGKLLSTR
jgi:hypothetical protein